MVLIRSYPAGTQRQNKVISTLMGRRIDVDTSLFQGCVPAGYYITGSQLVHSSGPPSRRAVGGPTMYASWGFRIMDVTLRVSSYIVNYKGHRDLRTWEDIF